MRDDAEDADVFKHDNDAGAESAHKRDGGGGGGGRAVTHEDEQDPLAPGRRPPSSSFAPHTVSIAT